jgi:hypothetical protein
MENLKGNTLLKETIWTKWEKTVQKTDSRVLGLAPDTFFSTPIFFCLWEKDKWPRFRIFQSLLRYRKESSVEIIEEQPREKMIKDFYSRRIFKSQYKMYDRYQTVKSCTRRYLWLRPLISDHICSLGNVKSRLRPWFSLNWVFYSFH